MTTKRTAILLLGLLLGVAAATVGTTSSGAAQQSSAFPEVIPVPDGFNPEGIATGRGTDVFVGSLVGGAVYKADLRTGEATFVTQQRPDRSALGLAVDVRTNHVWVAGGPFGSAYVYDGDTGADVAAIDLNGLSFPETIVNDVVVTSDAVYFTDSFRPYLYRVPLGPGGSLSSPPVVESIPLGGDFVSVPGGFNANGIEATPDGSALLVVNTDSGALYRVDPLTGLATTIDLGGASLVNGDGILLQGHTLYVVQNFLNQIAVVELAPDLTQGTVSHEITSPLFRVPTTVAGFGDSLYAVNARFDVAPPPLPGFPPPDPTIEFEAVRVPRR